MYAPARGLFHGNRFRLLCQGAGIRALEPTGDVRMNRREFLAGIGAASAAAPLAAWATSNLPAFPVLFTGNPTGAQQTQRRAFSDGLIELDLAPGNTFEINNWGMFGEFDRAAEMVQRLASGLICTVGQAAAMAAVDEARVYPNFHVIMLDATEAVEAGLVDSLDNPGLSVTGLTAPDTTPRLIQLARALAPEGVPVGMVINISNPLHTLHVGHAENAQGGLPVVRADLSGHDGIEAAFDVLENAGVGAILVPADEVLAEARDRVIARAELARVPAVYGSAGDAEAGGLAAIHADTTAMARTAARYVAALFDGTHSRDMALELGPEVFAINLGTARAQGVQIPENILARADLLIE